MNNRAILVRYHEIALKGQNRGWFEDLLAKNARLLLARDTTLKIETTLERGRLIVHAPWNDQVKQSLRYLFGASNFSPMCKVPTDRQSLEEAAIEEFDTLVREKGLPRSFRVFTRRSEKSLGQTSMEIDAWIGAAIKNRFPSIEVKLKQPEATLGIEIRSGHSYIWTEKVPGPGGMPVGTNGKVLALMSGGLDSPVAALRLLKRGAAVSFVHFFGTPFVGPEVLEKIASLIKIINRYQPSPALLYVVPFGKLQETIALICPPRFRTVLYRRMMVRIACSLSAKIGAQALVTGESLGQVASQTLENIVTIDSCSTLPILRPLIALDKDEIILAAQAWGTYETSILPVADCCTLFADHHPATRTNTETMSAIEANIPIDSLVKEALAHLETL